MPKNKGLIHGDGIVALQEATVNPNLLDVEYAVRGEIPILASKLVAQGRTIAMCNIGNPQSFDQKPLTYGRQLVAATELPSLLRLGFFPEDVAQKARILLSDFHGKSAGSYSPTKGYGAVRKAVADFVSRRDGTDAPDPENIILTNGASEAGKITLETLISKPTDAILISKPQYPLYSATITEFGGTALYYDLDEEKGWTLNRKHLQGELEKAVSKGLNVKAIVVIDPHNPTGGMLTRDDKEFIIGLAAKYNFVIIADEVYQENTYGEAWESMASILVKMPKYKDVVQIIEYHSVSKGYWGECGKRGGWMRFINPAHVRDKDNKTVSIVDVVEKMMATRLSPNTDGQTMVYAMVTQPLPGEPSYALFEQERRDILDSLARKAQLMDEAFRQMKGVEIFGKFSALYRFPRIWLPGGVTDFDYCKELLQSDAGICIVPGSGFGMPGHVRWATLPSEQLLRELLPKAVEWHNSSRYAR